MQSFPGLGARPTATTAPPAGEQDYIWEAAKQAAVGAGLVALGAAMLWLNKRSTQQSQASVYQPHTDNPYHIGSFGTRCKLPSIDDTSAPEPRIAIGLQGSLTAARQQILKDRAIHQNDQAIWNQRRLELIAACADLPACARDPGLNERLQDLQRKIDAFAGQPVPPSQSQQRVASLRTMTEFTQTAKQLEGALFKVARWQETQAQWQEQRKHWQYDVEGAPIQRAQAAPVASSPQRPQIQDVATQLDGQMRTSTNKRKHASSQAVAPQAEPVATSPAAVELSEDSKTQMTQALGKAMQAQNRHSGKLPNGDANILRNEFMQAIGGQNKSHQRHGKQELASSSLSVAAIIRNMLRKVNAPGMNEAIREFLGTELRITV